ALVEERLLARDRRHRDRGKPRLCDPLERPAHQLGLEQRERAFEAIGATARNLGDAAEVAPVVLFDQGHMVERLEAELRRLADGADDSVEALVWSDGRALVRNARELQ